jgi:malto-oligosyltrehalose trehalohydrolase
MPFGAEVLTAGRVRFSLWAPAAQHIELCLEDGTATTMLPLEPTGNGWFQLITSAACAGSRYYYRINGDRGVPDPASRFQPDDVHGASEVVDPHAFIWQDSGWRGRPWETAVIYELHVGSFTPQGTFAAIKARLDHLLELGITALELMPVADFPGRWNWGYDGALPFAPDSRYGRPEDLKDLIQTAHSKGLMVFLDVVYNHFGPEGNYLHLYAPPFFTERHHTPWGAAINFDGVDSRPVRDFFIHNALYWLEEYHLDGLRLDAVHAILDDSTPHILMELAQAVHAGPGRQRQVHLVLENDHNQAHFLERTTPGYTAQWNDDCHHALHVLTTGETGGYYLDYAAQPAAQLGRCLAEGFAYQGECSTYRHGAPRGERSSHLPATAFVTFLQNHDQVGNRACGERLVQLAILPALTAVTAILLLAPSPPLLFMGQEWGSEQPFPFFCDFGPDLAPKVTAGRRQEFARFPEFSDPAAQARIPDPNAQTTFQSAILNWDALADDQSQHWLTLHRKLLTLRHTEIIPRLAGISGGAAHYRLLSERALAIEWRLGDGSHLHLIANLGEAPMQLTEQPTGRLLYATPDEAGTAGDRGVLPAWSVAWYLQET